MGSETGDDAAVWRIDEQRALVATADFITPLVDDPASWGKIAAANSVSDVYAMGGRPLFGLNLVAWNSAELPSSLLTDVLDGATRIATESGFAIIGGHTVDDPEPKYGLAVIGEVPPDRILTNTGLRPGDALVLTKPLGTGIVATAIKQDQAPADVVAAAVTSMTTTNARAAQAALDAGATGATDVTGFGLLGHLGRMATASHVDVDLEPAAVPALPGVPDLLARGLIPGGTRRNLDWVRDQLDPGACDETTLLLLADAQTSGGLLFGADPTQAARAAEELGAPATVIGHARPGSGQISLR